VSVTLHQSIDLPFGRWHWCGWAAMLSVLNSDKFH